MQENLADVLRFTLKKIVKNHLWEDTTIMRGKGVSGYKNQYTFFVRNEVLNINCYSY